MRLWEPKPMPVVVRNGVFAVTLAIALVMMAINVPHVVEHLHQNGVDDASQYFYAAMPDLLLFIGAIILKYRPKFPTGWVMLLGGMAWLVWAALSVADNSCSAKVLAVLPVVFVAVLGISLDFSKLDAPAVPVRKVKKELTPKVARHVVQAAPPAETSPDVEVPAEQPQETSRPPEVPAAVESVPEPRTATDEDLDRVGRPIIESGGGAPKVKAALKAEGLRCSSERVAGYVATVKAELAGNVVQLRSAAQ